MQPDFDDIQHIIDAALAEDIGQGDVTSHLLIPENKKAQLSLITREAVVVAGLGVAESVFKSISSDIVFFSLSKDGEMAPAGTILAEVSGAARDILTAERTALNLLQRICGVATLTRKYVDAVKATKAIILDTRKTMPGLRILDKYAVRCGGGQNHRMGLYDMVLIKDNHIALMGSIKAAVEKARTHTDLPIEVECDTLALVEEALLTGVERILLDNMTIPDLRRAVQCVAGRAKLEASGNVTLENVRDIAQTGVDFISIGGLTHSARAVDIGLDITLS